VIATNGSPQQTVQMFMDLVGRHENAFYHFVHQVHSKGRGLFDDLMRWIELFVNLVRDGLPQPISLEFLLPHAGEERMVIMAEVDEIIEYHRKLKVAHHERLRKRVNQGETTGADEDAAFVEGVMNNLNLGRVGDDMDDLTAEQSDEDEPSDDENYADAPESQPTSPSRERTDQRKKKKKTALIEPPRLEQIPKLLSVFTELVRPSLMQAREEARTRT